MNHPIFELGNRVALVQRTDNPNLFGVAMPGVKVCPLPHGYDGLTAVHWKDGYVLAFHPKMPPLLCDMNKGQVHEIDAELVPIGAPGVHSPHPQIVH